MMNDNAAIRQAIRTVAFDEALADHLGLNPTDLRCLELVIADLGLTPSRLADLAGLTTGAVTGVVDRLERAGYVSRQPDPADRRSVTISPVPARVAEVIDALEPLSAGVNGLLAACSDTERAAIARFLADAGRVVAEETARFRVETRGGFWDDVFSAPLGGITRGRLVFGTGAPRVALNFAPLGPGATARLIMETSASRLAFTGAAPADDLIKATFDGPRPDVRVSNGVVTVRYRRQPTSAFSARTAKVALSGAIPWTIEVDGGITDLIGTLTGVPLERLDVAGGANHVRLDLPRPVGTASVRIAGVVSSARFKRPAGVPVALRLAGGVSQVRVDGARRKNVSGQQRYEGKGFADSPDRYELEVLGGASELIVS
jgi:DNA-binding MarR family transcriptional regulator